MARRDFTPLPSRPLSIPRPGLASWVHQTAPYDLPDDLLDADELAVISFSTGNCRVRYPHGGVHAHLGQQRDGRRRAVRPAGVGGQESGRPAMSGIPGSGQ